MVKQFDAEITDGTFAGDVSALEGTFQGTLTADAVDAAKNLTIAGRSVARSWAFYIASKGPAGFDDTDAYNNPVFEYQFYIPEGEEGILNIYCQYLIDDTRGDNDAFPTMYWIYLNGQTISQAKGYQRFGYYYRHQKLMYHSATATATAGYNTLVLFYDWQDISTNVYPQFRDVITRVDFIKK